VGRSNCPRQGRSVKGTISCLVSFLSSVRFQVSSSSSSKQKWWSSGQQYI
jgi:hypothetical protein